MSFILWQQSILRYHTFVLLLHEDSFEKSWQLSNKKFTLSFSLCETSYSCGWKFN